MSSFEPPPLDATIVDEEGKLKTPWIEYIEALRNEIVQLRTDLETLEAEVDGYHP